VDGSLAEVEYLIEARRLDDAVRRVTEHLLAAPADDHALCLLAQCRLLQDDAAAALRSADAAVRGDPGREWGHRLRSLALVQLGRGREASAAARESVRLAPHEWRTHHQLAVALVEHGLWWRQWEAYRAARRAVQLAPHQPDVHVALGLAAGRLGRRREERAAYRRALELDPHYPYALNNLAAIEVNHGRLGRGVPTLMLALRSAPHDRQIAANLDIVAYRLVLRLTVALLLGGLALTGMMLAEGDGRLPVWWPRGLGGLALLGACALLAWRTVRHLPPGARLHLRTFPRRLRGGRVLVALAFPVVGGSALGAAFLPRRAAEIAALPLLAVLRGLWLVVVVAIVVASVSTAVGRTLARTAGRYLRRSRP
jgi:Flp pilus assembly protein TadD